VVHFGNGLIPNYLGISKKETPQKWGVFISLYFIDII